jgi:hypothetical protein
LKQEIKRGALLRGGGTVPSAGLRLEMETRTGPVGESCESGFLLDWLAGGVACQRNIQGFSFKFENLSVVRSH